MTTTAVHKPDSLERRYNISLSQSEFEALIDEKVSELTKTARLPGFRVGKVPHDILKNNFRNSLDTNVRKEIFEAEWEKILAEKGNQPLETPLVSFGEKETETKDQGFTCHIRFETSPPIPDIDTSKRLNIQRPDVNDLELMTDRRLLMWRSGRGQYVDVSDDYRASTFDRVIWEVQPLKNESGEPVEEEATQLDPVLSDPEAPEESLEFLSHGVQVGQEMELNELLMAVDNSIVRDTMPIDVGAFRVRVVSIQKSQPLEEGDEALHELGYQDFSEIRTQLSNHLAKFTTSLTDKVVQDRLFDQLIAILDIDLPPVLLLKKTNWVYHQRLLKSLSRGDKNGDLYQKEITRLRKVTGSEHVLIYGGSDHEDSQSSEEDVQSAELLRLSDDDPTLVELHKKAEQEGQRELKIDLMLRHFVEKYKIKEDVTGEELSQWVKEKTASEYQSWHLESRLVKDEEFRRNSIQALMLERVAKFVLNLIVDLTDEPVSFTELKRLAIKKQTQNSD